MKKPSDKIFKLVKSISLQERVRLAYWAKTFESPPKSYLLFQEIDSLKIYDEEKLKAFYNQTFNSKTSLSRAKSILINVLLRFIAKGESEGEISIEEHYKAVRQLAERGLFDIAESEIKKAKRKCSSREDFFTLVRLLKTEKKIVYHLYSKEKFKNEIKRIYSELEEAATLAKTLESLEEIEDRSFLEFQKGIQTFGENSTEKLKELEKKVKAALRDSESKRIQLQSHRLLSRIANFKRHFQSALSHYLKVVRLYEENSFLLSESFQDYSRAVFSISGFYAILNEKESALVWMAKLEPLGNSEPFQKEFVKELYHVRYLSFLRFYKEVQPKKDFFPKIEQNLNRRRGIGGTRLHYLQAIYAANLLFFDQKHEESLRFVRYAVETNTSQTATDVQFAARILELVILFELEEISLFESKFRSFRRFRKVNEIRWKFAPIILQGLQKHFGVKNSFEFYTWAQKTLEIAQKEKTSIEASVIVFFNFEEWLESKAANH